MSQKLFISDTEYHAADGVANSTLLMIQDSPADIAWLKNAPVDAAKKDAADFGSAFHLAMLEPEKFDDKVLVSSVAGRTTKTFAKEVTDNPSKIVLTELEAQQIRMMQASAMAHPSAARIMNTVSDKESSIFINDKATDLRLKIRPDIDAVKAGGFLCNLKTTASIADWRSDKHWINPIEKFNYWHDASYSIYVAEQFYGVEIKQYKFLVVQKSIALGRYPVSVFTMTKQQLVDRGYMDQMLANLAEYASRAESNNWHYEESIPDFGGDGLEISEVE